MINVFTVCLKAPEDKHNDRVMIPLYQMKTNANAWLANMTVSDANALLRDNGVF